MDNRPIVIKGDRVALGVLVKEDIDVLWYWVNDKEVTQYLSENLFHKIHTREMEKNWLESILEGKEDTLTFAILLLPEYRMVGIISLSRINWINRNAELAIFIGAKELWGKGIGTEAIILLLVYAFNILDLKKVYLRVFEYNKRAIRCYEKVGFRRVGVLRKHRLRHGKYWDVIIMDILEEEYKQRYKTRIKLNMNDT